LGIDALEIGVLGRGPFRVTVDGTAAGPVVRVTPPGADVRVIEAARRGDRLAFAELYRSYVRMVHGVLLARVPRPEVDDLVQDVFLTAMDRLPMLREAAAFPGWLAAIARNRATDFLRRRHLTTVEMLVEPAAPDVDTSAALAVLSEIRALPEAYRETLVLRLVEGLTGPEIAARTGLTHASVRVNLHRGMKLLRVRLDGSATT
jgi:RNA polymerase sigma-70 factor (ECF subfamily)